MKASKLFLGALILGGFVGWGEGYGAGASDAKQTVSGGGVTVAVTYVNPRSHESPQFQVTLNTHSVSLDNYDLKDLALLRDGLGKSYAPTKVENMGSGHHRQVALTFPEIAPDAKRVEIIIKDIAGVKERIFRWTLD